MPGVSDHAEPVCGLAMAPATVLPSRFTHPVSARKSAFAAQYPAHDSPHQRFTADLAVSGAWSGAGAAGYAFTVWNLHPLLLAGLPAQGDRVNAGSVDTSPTTWERSPCASAAGEGAARRSPLTRQTAFADLSPLGGAR